MRKKEQIPYVVERQYLAKFTIEELVIALIKSHVDPKTVRRLDR